MLAVTLDNTSLVGRGWVIEVGSLAFQVGWTATDADPSVTEKTHRPRTRITWIQEIRHVLKIYPVDAYSLEYNCT